MILLGGGLFAVVLAPPFVGAALGVMRVDAKLSTLGADFTRIPRFPERSTIYANDGKTELATVYLDNRELIRLKDVSKQAQRAVLAIEDAEFYDHGALNWSSLVRALIENAQAGEVVQGGSTITQQLVGATLESASSTRASRASSRSSRSRSGSRRNTRSRRSSSCT